MKNPDIAVNCKGAASRAIPHMETIKRTAKLFGLAEHFVRQLVLSGEIVAVKAGCKYLVNCDKLTEYLNTSRVTAQTGVQEEAVSGITPIPVNFR